MTREQIKFGLIKTEEEFQDLKRFAESFDHSVEATSIFPIYTIARGDELIGYCNVMRQPVLHPSLHPGLATPRNFYDALQYAKQSFCLSSIDDRFPHGICVMALPRDLVVPDDAVVKCGFKNTNKEIWMAIP